MRISIKYLRYSRRVTSVLPFVATRSLDAASSMSFSSRGNTSSISGRNLPPWSSSTSRCARGMSYACGAEGLKFAAARSGRMGRSWA